MSSELFTNAVPRNFTGIRHGFYEMHSYFSNARYRKNETRTCGPRVLVCAYAYSDLSCRLVHLAMLASTAAVTTRTQVMKSDLEGISHSDYGAHSALCPNARLVGAKLKSVI